MENAMEPADVERRYYQITVYTASSRQGIPRIIIISQGHTQMPDNFIYIFSIRFSMQS